MSLRAKELISPLNKTLGQENIKLNEGKLKEVVLKMQIKFLDVELKFTFAITFVLLIGLVATSVME